MAQALYLAIPTLIIPAPSLANRANLPSYARAIANILQIGGAGAYTQVVIRIPISDPTELIQQGPAGGAAGAVGTGSATPTGAIPNSPSRPPVSAPPTSKHHKRISSLSTRPQSFHQAGNSISLQPNGMRNASGASAMSQASSVISARSAVAAQTMGGDPSSTWEMWDTIRSLCGYHPRLSVSEFSSVAGVLRCVVIKLMMGVRRDDGKLLG